MVNRLVVLSVHVSLGTLRLFFCLVIVLGCCITLVVGIGAHLLQLWCNY